MFECEYGVFINEYGREERYTCKELTSRMTGHVYSGSPFETDSSCGNCDGGRCNSCREAYTVSRYGVPRLTKEGYQKEVIINRRVLTDKDEALQYYMNL